MTQDTKDPDSRGKLTAALYMYENYPCNFSNRYFGDPDQVKKSVASIKDKFKNKKPKWGEYQKFAIKNGGSESNWHHDPEKAKKLYRFWESAVHEAREALRKLPSPDGNSNLRDHLDREVQSALFDKHQDPDKPDETGVPILVRVGYQQVPCPRHELETKWVTVEHPQGSGKLIPALAIHMTCPNGGWIGTAVFDRTPRTFGQYEATYVVPNAPAPVDPTGPKQQILFIFNGLESRPDDAAGTGKPPGILQPVLQWTSPKGDPASDDPNWAGWAVRSWYVPATYKPTFDDMPGIDDEKPFTGPTAPAWTKAVRVKEGDTIQGVIRWESVGGVYQYVSKLDWTSTATGKTTTVAVLGAPEIVPLTLPVAVVEGYLPGKVGEDRWSRNTLVDVEMKDIALNDAAGAPVRLSWDVGKPGDGSVTFPTDALKWYKVRPSHQNTWLKFDAKDRLLPP